jgi:CubicO group peptidase (beta-lactamase class C family)
MKVRDALRLLPCAPIRARVHRLVLSLALLAPARMQAATQPARGALPRATPEAMGMSSAALDRATALLQAHIDAGDIAGVVAAVMRDGHVVHHVALGTRDVTTGEPMPKDALFRLYSMTRPVTSTAILLLHDEGRLNVHDPLVKWLPAFTGQPVLAASADGARRDTGRDIPPARPRNGDITLAQLLTHSSGIGSRDAPLYRAHGVHRWDKTLAAVVDGVAALPLFEDPGTRFRYGMHAEVLGRVIEVVAGQSVETFLRERLFEPLGMRDAVFRVDPARAPRLATVHRKNADGRLRPYAMETLDVTDDRRLVSAGVGLVASTDDMLRFGQFFLDEGRAGDRRLLSPAVARLARENAVPDAILPLPGGGYWAGSGWTLGGFAVALDPSRYNHPVRRGEFWWDGSAGTRFWIDPVERLVIVVNAQLSPAGGGGFRERFRAAVEEALVVRKEGGR